MKQYGVAAFSLPDFAVESQEIWGTLETMSTPPSSSASSTSGDDNGSERATQASISGSGSILSIPIESERGRYQDLYTNLFATIRKGAEPAVQWNEAELTMLITELAIQSSNEGRTVQVPSGDVEEVVVHQEKSPATIRTSAGTFKRKLGRSLFKSASSRKVDAGSS